jgi:two-component system NtrC family sensor kinase
VLKYKLIKWFAGLVLVFGALSAMLGIWAIRQRIVQEAQTRVRYDLSSAWAVYQSQLEAMKTVARLMAVRGPLVEACDAQKWQESAAWQEVQGILGRARLDFQLDFIAVVSPEGQVVARASPPYRTGDYRTSDPIVAEALSGMASSGTVLLSPEELNQEADGLLDRAFLSLQETPHARPSPRTSEQRGMAMMAAAPIEKNGRVIGAIYAGSLLNRNEAMVERIQDIVFGQERYNGMSLGTVTVFLADTRIATTVRFENGNRAIGTRVSGEVADRVLDNGAGWADRAFVVRDWYLTAYDPIRDPQGAVIGMLYVGTLERPFRDMNRVIVLRYSALVAVALLVALVIAMFVAGRLAKPLHRLAEQADRMRHGQGYDPVPCNRACLETAGLIQAFNEMASTLTDRERQLKEANEQLGQKNDSLKGLNAHYMETLQFVSHELNSPLSSILNYAYMLRQGLLGPLTEKQTSALDVVSGNLKHVMEMIRHYLNLARIESGEIQPVPARVAVREEVIAPILASLQAEMHAKNLRVEDLIGPKVILQADLNMTREVFENLLGNAVKYGRSGGLISLNCRCNGTWAEFSVRNEGEGIPPERRGELFQKFSRIEVGESKKARRGTGLGLFISKKIVEAHGGTILAESEVGHWTEFRCTLPLARDSHPAESRNIGEVQAT